jgi:hypothetical protein
MGLFESVRCHIRDFKKIVILIKSVDKSDLKEQFLQFAGFLKIILFWCGKKPCNEGFYPEGKPVITHSYPQLMSVIHSLNGFIHRFV